MRYLDCPKESFAWKLRQLLTDGSAAIDPAVGQFWHELIGDSPPRLSTEIQRAAYAILWMGLRGERDGLPSMLATSFAEAAGVSGRQKWGLVLSSSARVSQVTYQTVVGVRYPELVTFNGNQWRFGKYVPQERPLRGGFLPIFWDVPRANIHAVEDIGAVVDWLTERCEFQADAKSNLAVLHNRNDMTNLFRASNWVSSSHDSIVSRGVTTCAGMTAHTVLLAQTKVGFLTGGRKKSFLMLSEDEQMVQLEEAYARATVAITRARSLCLIMGPLDMKGLLGAATVMGTLMYGAGHVWAGHAHFYLHDGEPSRSPSDETFIDMLQQNCCRTEKENDPAVAWLGLQRILNHPNNGSHRLLAPASVTGLGVPVMLIPYRSGFRPTGLQLCYNSCNRRKIAIVQITRPGWTRRWLLRIFASNGKRHGQTDVCSSRLAIIEMAPGRATFVC